MSYLFLQAATENGGIIESITGNVQWLVVGVVLIAGALILFHFLKNLVVNSILGLIAWVILSSVFGIALPFWPTLIVTALFGLAGIGIMVLLAFFGIISGA